MRFPKLIGALLLMMVPLTACTREVPTPVAPSPTIPADLPQTGTFTITDLVGLWQMESGSMMPDFIAGLATYGVTADVTALQINDDGTGLVWFSDRLTGAKDRVRAFVLFDDDDQTLVFDFGAETTTDVTFNLALERMTYVYPVVAVDGSSLGVADAEGRVALFSRVASLPADVLLGDLQIVAQYSVPAPQFFGDLANFGGDLIFNSGTAGQIESFDLATKAMGAPLGPTSSRLVQTAQGIYFWTHCGCGGSRDAYKRTMTALYDTVSSEDEMGGAITFRAMAYVGATNRLWLHGRPFDSQFASFYVMNTNGEPDVVDQQISFNRDLRALSFDGTELWGVVTVASQSVVRIDPVTGKVMESYEVPDVDVSWSGLEIVGDRLYMLGTDLDGEGVLFEMILPTALSAV